MDEAHYIATVHTAITFREVNSSILKVCLFEPSGNPAGQVPRDPHVAGQMGDGLGAHVSNDDGHVSLNLHHLPSIFVRCMGAYRVIHRPARVAMCMNAAYP